MKDSSVTIDESLENGNSDNEIRQVTEKYSNMIYLIGGVPRAGKSTLAKRLVKEMDVPFISSDFIVDMLDKTLPELKFIEPYSEIINKFYPFLQNLLKTISKSIKDYCIEGDAFSPEQVSELKNIYNIKTCFIGFSKVSIENISCILEKMTGRKICQNNEEQIL